MGRSRKPAARKPLAPKDSNIGHHSQPHPQLTNDVVTQMVDANHREADRRIAAIRAVRDAEVEGYLTQLRVALSMLSQEVRMMSLGEFVSSFCPDMEFIRAPDSHIVELRPKPQKSSLPDCSHATESFEFHAHSIPSLQLQAQPTPHGFPFNSSTVKDFSIQISKKAAQDEVVLHNQSEDGEFLHFMESFRSSKFFQSTVKTPATSMVGVTPKTTRLPKKGETLLSINGSPLGVFEKDGIASIPEERPRRVQRRLRASAMLSND